MDQITLKNFRCFREEQTARLAPLTLLVGENSTGKTSFIAMLKALWDVAHRHRVPDFKEEPYDLGSFDEIAHYRGGRGGRAGTFEAGFDFTRKGRKAEKDEALRFEAIFEKRGTIPVPVKRLLSDRSKRVWVELGLAHDGSWDFRFGTPKGSWEAREVVDFGFRGNDDDQMVPLFLFTNFFMRSVHSIEKGRGKRAKLTPLEGSGQPNTTDLELVEKMCSSEMRYFHEPLYASAPVRSKPRRTYDPSRASRDPEGDYIPMYLANLYAQDKVQWETLKDALEKFGDAAGLFNEISVISLGRTASGPFQLQVRRYDQKAKGPRRNLIDVGYGVSQVLPVITELLRNDVPRLVLLQQPEVHLHPSAQAALGTLFCGIAHRNRQLIVETHSDHLLDRVRMEVRDGDVSLKPEDVSILYFERCDLDVRIHSLQIDTEGNILGAPEGYRNFFLEETARSLWKRRSVEN